MLIEKGVFTDPMGFKRTKTPNKSSNSLNSPDITPNDVNIDKETFLKAISNLDAVRAEKCKRSLKCFIQEFWEVISDDPLIWNWHLDYLCDELEKVARRVARRERKEYDLIVNVPPGTTKTTTVSIMFPAWCWINWPWMKFITGSHGATLSLESAEKSRDVIQSEQFQKYFPYLQVRRDKNKKSNFMIQEHVYDRNGDFKGTRDRGNRYSTSVGGATIGMHGHINIIDDPIDPKGNISEAVVREANYWMDETLSQRKADKKITVLILIMQRLKEDDPAGHLLEERDNIKHICLPGEIRTEKYEDNVKPPELKENYEDGLLDPNRMPWDVLTDMESELGQLGYAGQVGQLPTPPGGSLFEVDKFNIQERPPTPREIVEIVRYWDKAGTSEEEMRKQKSDAAFTVGTKMAKLKNGMYIVLDVRRGRWKPKTREKIIRRTAEADGEDVIIYHEQEPGSGGKESAQATTRNLAGFVAKPDRPTGDKTKRADPYSVQVNRGNVILLRGDWNKNFIDEHRFFPNGKYKDQVDSASGAFNKLAQKKSAGPIV